MNTKSKLLIVDDDEQNLMLIQSLLEQEYILHTVSNGQQALDIFNTFMPDVILLDWNMPVLDGLSTLKAIKENELTKHIQVIMMTGYMAEQEDLLTAYTIGVIDFIRKPFDTLELKARVNSVVQLSLFYKEELEKKDRELISLAVRLAENTEFIRDLINQLDKLKNSFIDINHVMGNITTIQQHLSSKVLDTSWSQFNEHFVNVHADFFTNLSHAHQDLSPSEIKLSALLKLNLSSKEISAITHSTIESVKVARTRLRKKLNLETEANLTGYLMKF